jgi:hypothetical protein
VGSTASALDPIVAIAFHGAASLRRARAFHPVGISFAGDALVDPSAPAGFPVGSFDCVVRFSRGIGLPEVLPDLLGVGLRLVDAVGDAEPQDLLATSCGRSPVGRRLLRPSRALGSGMTGTILPYEVAGRPVRFGLRVVTPGRWRLSDLAAAPLQAVAMHPPLLLELSVAGSTGPWEPFGSVQLDTRLDAPEDRALDLDPFRTAPEVRPVGWVNRLRRPAYGASRRGRHAVGG